jgi:hypothetical protein
MKICSLLLICSYLEIMQNSFFKCTFKLGYLPLTQILQNLHLSTFCQNYVNIMLCIYLLTYHHLGVAEVEVGPPRDCQRWGRSPPSWSSSRWPAQGYSSRPPHWLAVERRGSAGRNCVWRAGRRWNPRAGWQLRVDQGSCLHLFAWWQVPTCLWTFQSGTYNRTKL